MTTTSVQTRASSPAVTAPAVRIRGVTKTFGHGADETVALHDVNLDVAEREFLCIVGASGCGKSTLLNLVAGLDQADAGSVETNGHRVAFMFQEASLFPWLTAKQNVELAMKLRGVGGPERRDRAEELLTLVRLGGRGDRRPHELSGGMRQRAALARVLAQDADIVLMDEPFAALDAMTRDTMHDEIERIWSTVGLTILFVTHNVREATRLADRTILMESGPGRVKTEFVVPIERPRHHEDIAVAELTGKLTHELKAEVARHVA